MSQEEDDVLAALHASLRDQSAYEDEVIREATHSLAPSLPSLGGLPPLEGLSTSGVLPAALVLDYLRTVRRQLKESTDIATTDLLCFKEQILLAYLETVCGISQQDDGGPSIQEQRRQEKRKRQYLKAPPDEARLATSETSTAESVEETAAVPRRATKRRRFQEIVNEDEDPFQLTSKERQEIATRREQRRKRKEARRLQQMQEEESDEEVEFSDVDNGEEKKEAGSERADTDSAEDNDNLNAIPPIVCPLCSLPLRTTLEDDTERDAFLASHMQECRAGRRSSRARRSADPLKVHFAEDTYVDMLPVASQKGAAGGRRNSSQPKKKKRQVFRATTPSLDDMEGIDYEDRVDDWIENGLSRMKEMKERIALEDDIGDHGQWQAYGKGFFVPAWIHRRLFGYQRDGLKWLWGLHQQGCGGCLGDEMGLGKTVSVCSYLSALVSNRKIKCALIVVPATMLQHWMKELAVWAPGIRRILLHSSGEADGRSRSVSQRLLQSLASWLKRARNDRLYEAIDAEDEASHPPHSFCGTGYAVVTTYENVRRNPDVFSNHSWSYVVLDEAQKIRNPEADVTMAIKQLRTPHRIAMTGTPIQNDFSELWSIFDFCFPSRLGTLPAFQQELADPIKRGGYSNATPMQVQMAYRCALVVRDLISPYLLRRTKKEVKEVALMPKKTEHVLFCRLSEMQRSLYEAYLRSDDVSKVMRGSNNLLGAITMLRKICNHPDMVCDPSSVDRIVSNGFNLTSLSYEYESDSEDESEYVGSASTVQRSGKLEVLSKILPIWKKQGHRVLIFCQWRKTLDIIEHFVDMQGWKFGRLDGNTNVAARQRLVDRFNTDESYFGLLCTTRTGGVGLNLTGANRIILFDPDWNPQTDAQARERAWRFGQEKEVTVYRLITAGTVEEKIYQRQIFKTALSNRVLQDPRQRRLFSQRDLCDLFTLKADTGSVRSGADGSTDTAAYTQGIGVVDPVADINRGDDEGGTDNAKDDNEDTLKTVMRSKGLAGVFDHHFVEQDSSRKTTTVREMEAKAKEIARKALDSLRQSVEEEQARNDPPRFGGIAVLSASNSASSRTLLDSLRQRQSAATGTDTDVDDEAKKYAKSLRTIQNFVRLRRPTTEEILEQFEGTAVSKEPAVFRRLLKSVAVLHNGRWLMK